MAKPARMSSANDHSMGNFFMLCQLKQLNGEHLPELPQEKLTENEIRILQDALDGDFRAGYIRLREGEYQYDLAKAISSFELEIRFPDVRDLIRKLYGEEKANDIQFIRKIQTILKKMEKSQIVRILPKSKPWELQRYALSSFKFQDADKNLVTLATDEQIQQVRIILQSKLDAQNQHVLGSVYSMSRIVPLALAIFFSYGGILWSLIQPTIDPLVFVIAFTVAILCSVLLGQRLTRVAR
jgi:hypothetical protein